MMAGTASRPVRDDRAVEETRGRTVSIPTHHRIQDDSVTVRLWSEKTSNFKIALELRTQLFLYHLPLQPSFIAPKKVTV